MYCFITSPLAHSCLVTGTSNAPVNLLPALYAAAPKINPSEGGDYSFSVSGKMQPIS